LLLSPTSLSQKKNEKLQNLWRIFRDSKTWCNNTTLATQFTTITPQKHHTKSHVFLKTPCKTTFHHAQKKYQNTNSKSQATQKHPLATIHLSRD
jgi:hypothetical protein